MVVKRIVANVAADKIEAAEAFYVGVLGMRPIMDLGWIVTYGVDGSTEPQVSVMTEGGNGTPVPDLSIEVDDIWLVLQRARSGGWAIEYGPVTEDWGVTRFFVRDPFHRLINILSHIS
jgi:catechol 2,3-dioxygenase-like lactoylglutathione lyase family enzyme